MVLFDCRTAAEAALARVQSQRNDDTHFNTSLAAIRAQVQRELEAERKTKSQADKQTSQELAQPKTLDDEHNRNLAAQGVYFRYIDYFIFCIRFLFVYKTIRSIHNFLCSHNTLRRPNANRFGFVRRKVVVVVVVCVCVLSYAFQMEMCSNVML